MEGLKPLGVPAETAGDEKKQPGASKWPHTGKTVVHNKLFPACNSSPMEHTQCACNTVSLVNVSEVLVCCLCGAGLAAGVLAGLGQVWVGPGPLWIGFG